MLQNMEQVLTTASHFQRCRSKTRNKSSLVCGAREVDRLVFVTGPVAALPVDHDRPTVASLQFALLFNFFSGKKVEK